MSSVAHPVPAAAPSVQWAVGDSIADLSWSPDATRLAVADAAGSVTVLDLAGGAIVWSVMAHMAGALQVNWCADDHAIASAGQDGIVKLWDPRTGAVTGARRINDTWVDHLAWSPDCLKLAASAGTTLVVWNRAGQELLRYDQHRSTVSALAWRPNSKECASACYKGVQLFNLACATPYKTLHCLGSLISLGWSPAGDALAAGSQDRMLHFWRLPQHKGRSAEMKGYPEKVAHLAWQADGARLASAGGRAVVVWNTRGKGPQGTRPALLEGHAARITGLRYQHRGRCLASCDQAGAIRLWQTKTGATLNEPWTMGAEVTRLAWSPDDRLLAAGNSRGDIHSYDTQP